MKLFKPILIEPLNFKLIKDSSKVGKDVVVQNLCFIVCVYVLCCVCATQEGAL